jgi:hypothetical protein
LKSKFDESMVFCQNFVEIFYNSVNFEQNFKLSSKKKIEDNKTTKVKIVFEW